MTRQESRVARAGSEPQAGGPQRRAGGSGWGSAKPGQRQPGSPAGSEASVWRSLSGVTGAAGRLVFITGEDSSRGPRGCAEHEDRPVPAPARPTPLMGKVPAWHLDESGCRGPRD